MLRFAAARLVVAGVRGATVAIAVLNTGRAGDGGRGALLATERVPGLLVLGLGAIQLDVVGSRVARQGIGTVRVGVVLVAREPATAATRGVAVGRGRTETLLALVVAGEKDLEENGDEEQETSDEN